MCADSVDLHTCVHTYVHPRITAEMACKKEVPCIYLYGLTSAAAMCVFYIISINHTIFPYTWLSKHLYLFICGLCSNWLPHSLGSNYQLVNNYNYMYVYNSHADSYRMDYSHILNYLTLYRQTLQKFWGFGWLSLCCTKNM